MSADNSIWRERLVEVKAIRAGDIRSHPLNPKNHPDGQKAHIFGLLREVGKVDILKAYFSERNGGLTFFDGHCREEMEPDEIWNVGIYDIGDREADILVAAFDYPTREADYDQATLAALLESVQADDDAVNEMLASIADEVDAYALADVPGKSSSSDTASRTTDKEILVRAVLYLDKANIFESALRLTGKRNRAEALTEICEFYLAAKRQSELSTEETFAALVA